MALYDPKEFPAEAPAKVSPNELDALLLLDAQALIERGWCQSALQVDGGFCLLGAINQAATGNSSENDVAGHFGAYIAIAEAVGSRTGIAGAVDWNNAPERTQAEVIEAFGRAAEIARNGATSL